MIETRAVYVVVSNPPETSASYILWDNAYSDKEEAEAATESESFATVKELNVITND